MKKLIVTIVIALSLSACSVPSQTVVYDKKRQDVEKLEDKLEAKLAKENPGKWDVDITKKTKKAKKRRKH